MNRPSVLDALDFIEADVSMGTVIGGTGEVMPIMAHPPAITSDLSLAEFMRIAVEVGNYALTEQLRDLSTFAPNRPSSSARRRASSSTSSRSRSWSRR